MRAACRLHNLRTTGIFALCSVAAAGGADGLVRLPYNHPGLQVDLGVGL